MRPPFTGHFAVAVAVAHGALSLCLCATLWGRPFARRWCNLAFLFVLALGLLALIDGSGISSNSLVFFAGAALLAMAFFSLSRARVLVFAGASACLLLPSSVPTKVAIVLWLAGLLLGLIPHEEEAGELAQTAVRSWEDAGLFVAATSAAAACSVLLFDRLAISGDEWADTFQANLFAHGKAYAPEPSCPDAFRSSWVYFFQHRAFAQYTPGWPLFMAPFQLLGAAWLASPVAYGLLAVAVARLTRRIAAASRIDARAAGYFAAFSLVGYSALINGASRYPHVFVAAAFAWAAESLCVLTESPSARSEKLAGALLGTASGLLLAARPFDGAALGIGLALFCARALRQRRISGRGLAVAALVGGAWSTLALVILRAQLGRWFETGYSLADLLRPGEGPAFSWPALGDVEKHLALATGAYTWWPCAPALATVGLLAARKRAREIALMLLASSLALGLFYSRLHWIRVGVHGFGNRHYVPLQVAMAIGGGLWFARMNKGARALSIAACLFGLLGSGLCLYPDAAGFVGAKSALFRAVARDDLHRAVVLVQKGALRISPGDATQNFLLESDPDVLLLDDRYPLDGDCGFAHYPRRTFYRASGFGEVVFTQIGETP